MSESENPLAGLVEDLTETIEEVEGAQTKLDELGEWLEEAEGEWKKMSQENKDAFQRRARELQTQLRNADSPHELVDHGLGIKGAFSEPIEQTAVAGFHDTVELLELEISNERHDELEAAIRQRPPSDLQSDSEGYSFVCDSLEGESDFIRTKIADEVSSDLAKYLIGPNNHLTTLIEMAQRRQSTLESLEEAFADAGSWAPDTLQSLQEQEALYADLDESVDADAISEEIEDIDTHTDSVQFDIAGVVEAEVRDQLSECPPGEIRSRLNEIAVSLTQLQNHQKALNNAEKIIASEDIPETLSENLADLDSKVTEFSNASPSSLAGLNIKATGVSDQLNEFVESTSHELETLDSMCAEIRLSFDVSDINDTPTADDLGDLSSSAIRDKLDTAFSAIRAYQSWIDDAFGEIATQFEADNVRDLFERLYTENDVPLSEVNIDALHDLQDQIQVVVSLRR